MLEKTSHKLLCEVGTTLTEEESAETTQTVGKLDSRRSK